MGGLMKDIIKNPVNYRKFLVALATLLANLLALGLVPAEAQPYVITALNVLGAFGVYRLPNG